MAKRVEWSPASRAELRAIDRDTAMRILETLDRFLKTEHGDVKQLQDTDPPEFRLRIGDYRLRYSLNADTLLIHSIRHRSEAYH